VHQLLTLLILLINFLTDLIQVYLEHQAYELVLAEAQLEIIEQMDSFGDFWEIKEVLHVHYWVLLRVVALLEGVFRVAADCVVEDLKHIFSQSMINLVHSICVEEYLP